MALEAEIKVVLKFECSVFLDCLVRSFDVEKRQNESKLKLGFNQTCLRFINFLIQLGEDKKGFNDFLSKQTQPTMNRQTCGLRMRQLLRRKKYCKKTPYIIQKYGVDLSPKQTGSTMHPVIKKNKINEKCRIYKKNHFLSPANEINGETILSKSLTHAKTNYEFFFDSLISISPRKHCPAYFRRHWLLQDEAYVHSLGSYLLSTDVSAPVPIAHSIPPVTRYTQQTLKETVQEAVNRSLYDFGVNVDTSYRSAINVQEKQESYVLFEDRLQHLSIGCESFFANNTVLSEDDTDLRTEPSNQRLSFQSLPAFLMTLDSP